MEAVRIHIDSAETWEVTSKKVIAAFGDPGRVLLKYRKDEIDINPNGYENELVKKCRKRVLQNQKRLS